MSSHCRLPAVKRYGVADTGAMLPIAFSSTGALIHQYQADPVAAYGLYAPYPDDVALSQVVEIRTVEDDDPPQTRYTYPPQMLSRAGNDPMLSPDGRWVAHQAGRQVFTQETAGLGDDVVDTNPNVEFQGRRRIDEMGGIYLRWRDAETVEFASGNQYITVDARTGDRSVTSIDLRLPSAVAEGTLALTNARIITVEGDQVIDSGTVLVDGPRIACVGECDSASADRVIDLSGKFIVPGFWDMHNHHASEESGIITQRRPSSLANLAYGITSILDPAVTSRSAFPLAELTKAGRHLGPNIYSTAEIIFMQSTGMGDNIEVESYEDALFNVKHRADWGAASVKNYRKGRRWQHQQIIEAAREVGVTVTSEGGPMLFTLGLAMDGQTGFEHGIANLPIYSDVARFLGQADMVYSPTILIFGHLEGAHNYFRPRSDLLSNDKYLRFTQRSLLQAKFGRGELKDKSHFSFPIASEGLADIVRAAGTARWANMASRRGSAATGTFGHTRKR